MPDYEKLHKLNRDTVHRMTDKNCDPEKEMAKYKKQRNILLGASAAVTISLGTIVALLKKQNNALNSESKLYESLLNDLGDDYNKLSNNNGFDKLQHRIDNANEQSYRNGKSLIDYSIEADKKLGNITDSVKCIAELTEIDTLDIMNNISYLERVISDMYHFGYNIRDTEN